MRAHEAIESGPWDHPALKAREQFTDEQIDSFLEQIRQGIGRHIAARSIGTTGTVMRMLAREERDPEFAREYAEAEEEGKNFYADYLAAKARQRIERSDRILEVELAAKGGGEYAHLRRDRMKHEGTILHEHHVVLDLSRLNLLSNEQLSHLEEALEVLDASEPKALPPGESQAA